MDLRSIVSENLGSYAKPMSSVGGLVPTEEEDNWPANSGGGEGGGHGHVSGTDWANSPPHPIAHVEPHIPPATRPGPPGGAAIMKSPLGPHKRFPFHPEPLPDV